MSLVFGKQYPVGFESIFCEGKSTHNVLMQVTGQCQWFLLYSKVTFFFVMVLSQPLPLEAPLSSRGVILVKVTHCFLFLNLSSSCVSAATPLQGSGRLQNVFYNYIWVSCSQSAPHKNTCVFEAAASALSFEKGRCYWCFILVSWN